MPYKDGDRVEYRVNGGGASDNSEHSTGEITRIHEHEDELLYVIRNDNTGKETEYKEYHIVGKASSDWQGN